LIAALLAALLAELNPALILSACEALADTSDPCCPKKCSTEACFVSAQSVPGQSAVAKPRLAPPPIEFYAPSAWTRSIEAAGGRSEAEPSGPPLYLRNRVLLI
jgi:hypothetical protein